MNGVRPLVAGTAQEVMYRGYRAVVVCSYYFRYYHLPSIASLLFLSGSETVNRFYSVVVYGYMAGLKVQCWGFPEAPQKRKCTEGKT